MVVLLLGRAATPYTQTFFSPDGSRLDAVGELSTLQIKLLQLGSQELPWIQHPLLVLLGRSAGIRLVPISSLRGAQDRPLMRVRMIL